MNLWKVLDRFRSVFKGEQGVSAAPPIAKPVVRSECESQIVDEYVRSTKLEDLNLENWPLEDSFKLVSIFLDSKPYNSQDTEPEMSIKNSSPSSVSSSKGFSLHETSIQIYQKQDQQLEALEQQMDEISVLLAQSGLRREKLLAGALEQLQSTSAAVHFESATINIPNDSEVEPMTPRTKDMGVDPVFFHTTTMGIADTLPISHLADYGLLEGNPCSSNTKDELITTLPSTSSMKGERVPSTPNSCSATNCGTRILSANAVLEAETAPTPNLLQSHLSTSPMDSVCNAHFPGIKSPLSISKMLPDLLKESIEPRSAKHGLQDFILVDPPIFITWLPRGSTKTRPPGHRRGRPPRTSGEHLWQTMLLSLHDGRHHGRPHDQPRKQFFYHGHTNRRDIGVAALRTTISDRVHDPIYPSAYCVLGIIFCFIPAIPKSRRMLND